MATVRAAITAIVRVVTVRGALAGCLNRNLAGNRLAAFGGRRCSGQRASSAAMAATIAIGGRLAGF